MPVPPWSGPTIGTQLSFGPSALPSPRRHQATSPPAPGDLRLHLTVTALGEGTKAQLSFQNLVGPKSLRQVFTQW